MMKRVLFMINSLNGGGAEKVLQTVLLNLDENKYDITLFSMHREKIESLNYPKNITYKVVFDRYIGTNFLRKGISLLGLKIKGVAFRYLPSSLFYRLIIHNQFDIEIAFIEGESTKIISGSPNTNSKKYAWVHIDLQQNPWTSFLYNGVDDECEHYKKYDKILCVSESVRNAFLKRYSNVEDCKVQVQYNPIDRNKIVAMSMKNLCTIRSKKKHLLRMVAVGRLVHQKGFDRLLEVCSHLRDEGYLFEILIIGEGSERNKLENMIKNYNLSKTIELLGYVDNPYPFMATADLLM